MLVLTAVHSVIALEYSMLKPNRLQCPTLPVTSPAMLGMHARHYAKGRSTHRCTPAWKTQCLMQLQAMTTGPHCKLCTLHEHTTLTQLCPWLWQGPCSDSVSPLVPHLTGLGGSFCDQLCLLSMALLASASPLHLLSPDQGGHSCMGVHATSAWFTRLIMSPRTSPGAVSEARVVKPSAY